MASSAPTSTVSSSCTLISSSLPATGDGISVSTLSVETSSSGSSTATSSPTCLSQRVTVPSVTDSPSAGRVTGVAPLAPWAASASCAVWLEEGAVSWAGKPSSVWAAGGLVSVSVLRSPSSPAPSALPSSPDAPWSPPADSWAAAAGASLADCSSCCSSEGAASWPLSADSSPPPEPPDSPSSPTVHSSAPTSTVSSSCTLISIRVPATGEGISVSTLSVETSSRGSSTATWSPGCFSQRVTVPSVTDSPSAGRVTEVAIAFLRS